MRLAFSILCSFAIVGFSAQLSAQQAERSAVARSAELALSDETIQVRYRAPTDFGDQPNTEVAYAAFLSEDRDLQASAALLFGTRLNLGPFKIQLGPRVDAILLDEENNDVLALSIGGQARFDLVRSGALAIVGSAFWSPDVVTFGAANNLQDFMVRGEMRLSDRVTGFAGFRWFELDLLTSGDRKLQDELFAGINWRLR